MLRMLFGEEPREWEGKALETVQAIEKFIRLSSESAEMNPRQDFRLHTYQYWAEGLLRSMDELEQGIYAAKRFAARINHAQVDELSPQERLNYYRHVYFDKNSYIRIFALLDKLGTLLNSVLKLRTERIKAHFSYFTVLRNMRLNSLYPELSGALNELKERHQDALTRLRRRRNTEIHQMNAELQDDLEQTLINNGDGLRLENIKANIADLEEAWEMAISSLAYTFHFANNWIRKMG